MAGALTGVFEKFVAGFVNSALDNAVLDIFSNVTVVHEAFTRRCKAIRERGRGGFRCMHACNQLDGA